MPRAPIRKRHPTTKPQRGTNDPPTAGRFVSPQFCLRIVHALLLCKYMSNKRIVVMGGGTGTFTVLSGLKRHNIDLSAIVSVADNGGSTGILRDELGVLPPGDIRQCLVALSAGDDTLRRLFTYRFHEGSLSGQNFGNLFLSALEKVCGNSLVAIQEAHRILNVRGRVIPVAPIASNLFAELEDGSVLEGEHAIDVMKTPLSEIRRCFLSPAVQANGEAVQAIMQADVVVIGPGDLFTSLVPVLLVDGIAQALAMTRAKKLYVLNLVAPKDQAEQFSALSHCDAISTAMSPAKIDTVIVNSATPDVELLKKYEIGGDTLMKDDLEGTSYASVRASLLAGSVSDRISGDPLQRSLLRHDPEALAEAIIGLL